MSTIVTRAGKGSPLTNTELDANFTNLNTDKLEKSGTNTADKITFNLTAGLTPTQGELTWDADTGTLSIGLNGGATVLSIGEDQIYRVINQTGASIPMGTLVMAFGTVGNSGAIKIKAWDGTQPSKTILGLTAAAIPTEALPSATGLGYVLAFGKLRGIQTNGGNYSETWVDGDIIYAGASGGLTKTIPAAPNTKTTVAIVIGAHASNGTLFIRPTYGSNLSEDELVQLTSLANNNVLQYNSTTARFENKTPANAGLVTLTGNQTISGDTILSSANFAGNRVSRTSANYSALSYWNSAGQKGIAGFSDTNAFFIRSGTNGSDDWVILNGSLNTGTVPWARLSSVPTTLAGYSVTALQVAASTVKATSDTFNQTGIVYSDIAVLGQTDGAMYANAYSSLWQHQIFGDYRTGQIAVRGKNNNVWQSWRVVLDATNFNTYAPTLTGTGASGTWGVSVTGNAATATALQTARSINGVSFNGTANISITQTKSTDNRTVIPTESSAGYSELLFTSWNNNNTSPYADALHFRTYNDGTGGADNLVMFSKSGIGMRIWQQTFGSASAYATFKDVAFTDSSITGNAATVTNGVYTTGSYANPSWITSLAETKLTFTDVTTGDASTTSHGFLRKLNASTANFLRGDGAWATPPNTTYSEITTAEIDAGTASTLRTITGRRVGYILDTKVAGQITTAIAGKQDTLVSGTNIKTINGNSVLGSGNIALESGYATYAKFGGY